ncbi:MAG: cytochrome c family protein [Proteobacteria bacterium]|nr:cytochrome c family protein [Pseudomonadota bacterium]
MTEREGRRANPARAYILLVATGLLLVTMLYLYYVYPHQTLGPKQPIYFSHRVHSGVKQISCRFCHPFVDRSKNAGIPAVEKCLFCHRYIVSQHPQILRVKWHYESKTPIPWVRIFYLPDHAQFNHQRHIAKEIDCVVCHGNVKNMDRLMPVEFKMGFCIECHKREKAELDCWLACHQ